MDLKLSMLKPSLSEYIEIKIFAGSTLVSLEIYTSVA